MRTVVAFLLLYLLFLVQASVTPWWPDLVLLGLIAISLHETRLASAVAGACVGLCLDMTNPAFTGTSMLVLAVTGYGVASLRTLFYRARWATLLFVLMALALKWTALALFGPGPPGLAPLLVSSALTIALAPLAELGLTRLIYPGWQPA
jgi:rod shape-determining protein MreD